MTVPRRPPSPVVAPIGTTELRSALRDLTSRGTQEVEAVRRAFTAGVAPAQTTSSGSVADFVDRFAGTSGSAAAVVRSTARFGLSTSVVGTVQLPPRPELDQVEVSNDRSFGVLDSFFVRIVASLPITVAPRGAHMRIMRAAVGRTTVDKPAFSAMRDSTVLGYRTKSAELAASTVERIDELGVGNKLTDFVTNDQFTTQRSVVSSGTLRALPPSTNTNRIGTSSGLLSIENADPSVLENVQFYINRRTMSAVEYLQDELTVGQRQGLNVLQGSAVSSVPAVEVSNAAEFSEVARIPLATGRAIGAFLEVEHFDPAVVFGSSYTYYASIVDADGLEGPRSRLVKADVVRYNPPPAPTVLYSVIAGRPRFTIRSDGEFLDHVEIFRRGGAPPPNVRRLSTKRFMIDSGPPVTVDSGFYHIGDAGLGQDRSTAFTDKDAIGNQNLEYRFYTVDSFGLKSTTPFSCSLRIPDHGAPVPLSLPSITTEQGAGGRVVNISVVCDDPRITSFIVGRRELRTLEDAYRQPSQPDKFTFGATDAKRARSRIGPSMNPSSPKAWTGVLTAVSGAATFTDLSVEFDRVYQYAVQGVDIRGHKTSNVQALPVFVSVKPVVDAPVSIDATVVREAGIPTGVVVKWSGGTADFSPNDLIGDQDALAATSQRSVFQVERREIGGHTWDAMPATTESYFIDSVSDAEVPKFRPSYARVNAAYDYRVIAMQSGAFLSTYTDPVRVSVSPDISSPPMIWVRSTSTAVRPVNVVVSWQYHGQFVDAWDIERAITNKVFGSKIFSMDSREARDLPFERIGRVTRESSRGHGLGQEPNLDEKIFVGNRFYVDHDVDLANSYYYRIRSVGIDGTLSDWVYGGIMLTDSPHDRKLFSVLSQDERVALTADSRPISKWRRG